MARRNRNVAGGIRAGVVALPFALAVTCVGIAVAGADPAVQPGVTAPSAPADPQADQPAELRAAAPPSTAPAPRPRPAPETTTPDAPPPPAPRTVRVGDASVPVPDGVPDDVVRGIQNAIDLNAQPDH